MQVLQLYFSGSISCAALSERRKKREKDGETVNMSSFFCDFNLDNCSEHKDLNDYNAKLMLYLPKGN